ncbi:hypothetical protein QTN25_005455 [Entamoeba marina]
MQDVPKPILPPVIPFKQTNQLQQPKLTPFVPNPQTKYSEKDKYEELESKYEWLNSKYDILVMKHDVLEESLMILNILFIPSHDSPKLNLSQPTNTKRDENLEELKNKYDKMKIYYNKLDAKYKKLKESYGTLENENKKLLQKNIYLKQKLSTYTATPPKPDNPQIFTPSSIFQPDTPPKTENSQLYRPTRIQPLRDPQPLENKQTPFNPTTVQQVTPIYHHQPVFISPIGIHPTIVEPQSTIRPFTIQQQQQNQFSSTPNQSKQQEMEYQRQDQDRQQKQFVPQPIKQTTTKQQHQQDHKKQQEKERRIAIDKKRKERQEQEQQERQRQQQERQEKQRQQIGKSVSKQLNDEFEKISVELFKSQGLVVENNYNTVFDSSKTTTINRKKLQTGIQGNKQMNGIVGKQHVAIFVLTDDNDLFGIYHHNKIQLNNDDFNEDDQFFLFSLAKNGVYNPTIWEREGGIESINIYDPEYDDDDILEVYDAFIIERDSSIEVSEDFNKSYKRCSGDDELTSKEKPNMQKLLAIEWN